MMALFASFLVSRDQLPRCELEGRSLTTVSRTLIYVVVHGKVCCVPFLESEIP